MSILGTLAIAVAVPTYLIAIHTCLRSSPLLASSTRNTPTNSSPLPARFAQLAFWVAMAVALGSGMAEGRMGWIASHRGVQAVAIVLSLAATAMVTARSLQIWHLPIRCLPWSLRPIAPWAAFLLPPLLLFSTLFILQPALARVLPESMPRAVLVCVASVSLLANAFALGSAATRFGRSEAARAATLL